MDRPARLVLIRHGESLRNQAKKGAVYFADEEARKTIRGIPDHEIDLTEEGRRQARVTGTYLRERFGVPSYVYHSGFARTRQTAEGVLEAYTPEERAVINVRMNIALAERHPGYAYDMTREEAESHFPWLAEYWKTFGGFVARPPGGESLEDVVERAYRFLGMLFRERAGETVYAFTHGGWLRCCRFVLEHWTYAQAVHWPEGQSPRNCGVTVYEYDRGVHRLVLREYNTICY